MQWNFLELFEAFDNFWFQLKAWLGSKIYKSSRQAIFSPSAARIFSDLFFKSNIFIRIDH